MVVVAATPTSGAVSDLNEDEVGTRGPSDTTPSLPVHGRSFNKLDDAYEHCGSGQLLPYTRTSLAWTIAAPLTLLSVYLTYSGGSQLHGSAAAEQDKHIRQGFSATTEFGLYGAREGLKTAIEMSFWVGFILSTNPYGYACDVYGRLPVLVASVTVSSGFILLSATARSVYALIALTALSGASCSGIGISAFVLGVESVGPKWRGAAGIGQQVFWSVGVLTGATLAWIVQPVYGWRAYCAAISAPGFAFALLAASACAESPRWLVMNGRRAKAEQILTSMAWWNARWRGHAAAPVRLAEDAGGAGSGSARGAGGEVESLRSALRSATLRRLLALNAYLWFATSATYYGLNYNLGEIQGSFYLNNIIFGAVELAGVVFAMCTVDILGRKGVLPLCLSVAGVCCLTSGVVEWRGLQRIAVILGKAGISAVFALIFLYSGEQIPTSCRSQFIAIFSTFARCGSLLAPIIASLARVSNYLPFIVFGSLGGLACISSSFMPETMGRRLAETVDEVDDTFGVSSTAGSSSSSVSNSKGDSHRSNDDDAAPLLRSTPS